MLLIKLPVIVAVAIAVVMVAVIAIVAIVSVTAEVAVITKAIVPFLGEDLALLVDTDHEILAAKSEMGLGNQALLDTAAIAAAKFIHADRVTAQVETFEFNGPAIGYNGPAVDHHLEVPAAVEDHSGPAIGSHQQCGHHEAHCQGKDFFHRSCFYWYCD